MAYDSKGRLVLSHNVSTRENLDMIAECLGDFRISALGRDVGMLCTSPKISQWSKNKPFCAEMNQYKVQTDADRKAAAYGVYWFMGTSEYTDAPAAHTALELIQKAKSLGGTWKIKPHNGIYRAWDFDGYRHNAKMPYVYSCESRPSEQIKYPTAYRPSGNEYDSSLSISDMPHPLAANINKDWLDFHIVAIACYNEDNSYLKVGYTGRTVKDFATAMVPADAQIQLHGLGSDASRRYDFLWAATNVAEGTSGSDARDENLWVFLPGSLSSLLYSRGFAVEWASTAGLPTNTPFVVETNSRNVINKMDLYFDITDYTGGDVKIDWLVYLWEKGQSFDDLDAVARGTANDPDAGAPFEPYFEINILQSVLANLNFSLTKDNTMLAITLRTTAWNSGEQKTFHFDPVKNVVINGAATNADGYTVQDILNSLNK